MTITIPDSFADVWSGPAEHAEDAFALGVLTTITQPQDKRITDALSIMTPSGLLEMIADSSEDTIEARAAMFGFAVAQLGEMHHRIGTAVQAFDLARRSGQRLLTAAERALPSQFADLDVPPYALWVRGDIATLNSLSNAITVDGARASTGYGEQVTRTFVGDAVNDGKLIVAGGAYGIQGAANRAALSFGGKTIIVSASGLERFYPNGHSTLFEQVVDSGAAISEMAPGTSPTKWRFMARSRLLAAATPATVVVEAGHRSGALRTAGIAMNLGRISAAVPGPVTSPSSAGCHELIVQGTSRLVTSCSDLKALLEPALVV